MGQKSDIITYLMSSEKMIVCTCGIIMFQPPILTLMISQHWFHLSHCIIVIHKYLDSLKLSGDRYKKSHAKSPVAAAVKVVFIRSIQIFRFYIIFRVLFFTIYFFLIKNIGRTVLSEMIL